MPHFIAVASGKGGVGKTWFTISLAQCLARAGKRVLIFDCDFGLANIDIQLGLVPTHDLVDVLHHKVEMLDAFQSCSFGGAVFDVLPGRAGVSAIASVRLDVLEGLVLQLRGMDQYDYVFFDLCAGIDVVTRRLAALADTLLAVTTEEPTALADVYAVLKLYTRDRAHQGGGHARCRVVVNQAMTQRSGRDTFEKLGRACRSFLDWCPDLAGVIRKDSRVSSAIRQQSSVLERFPSTFAAVDIARIAESLG